MAAPGTRIGQLYTKQEVTIFSEYICMMQGQCYVRYRIQWNPSIAATLGEQNVGRYIGVAFIEGLFCTQTVHLGPGFLAVIQRWLLFRGGR